MIRIALLSVLLLVLLTPSLRSDAADQIATPLHPAPNYPQASGTVRVAAQGDRTLLSLDLHGLPMTSSRLYVVWVVAPDRRLYNAGALTVDQRGDAAGDLAAVPVAPGGLVLGVSAESFPDIPAPATPQSTVVLSGQLPDSAPRRTDHLSASLGPDWFAPIIPASLGFLLLRHARRLRRAERHRAAPPEPLGQPTELQ